MRASNRSVLVLVALASSIVQSLFSADPDASIQNKFRALLREKPTITIDAYVALVPRRSETHFVGRTNKPEAASALEKLLANYHFQPSDPLGPLGASEWIHFTVTKEKRKMDIWLVIDGKITILEEGENTRYYQGGNEPGVSLKVYETIIKKFSDDFTEVQP